jgi:hypothetical protein
LFEQLPDRCAQLLGIGRLVQYPETIYLRLSRCSRGNIPCENDVGHINIEIWPNLPYHINACLGLCG